MSPFRTLLWRETVEAYRRGGQARVSLLINLVIVLLVAVGAPVVAALFAAPEVGRAAALGGATAMVLGVVSFLGLLMPLPGVIDALAGERERHTLETLLTMPVSRAAVMAAKALALASMSFSLAAVAAAAFLLTALFSFGWAGLLAGLLLVVSAPLAATLAAAMLIGPGLMVSAKAPTIKEGQQRLVYVMSPVFLAPGAFTFLATFKLEGGAISDVWLLVLTTGLPLLLGASAIVAWSVAWKRMARARLMAV